jgi:GNAT superfamily N-acetyltransferase
MAAAHAFDEHDVRLLEQSEAEYFRRFLANPPEAARTAVGLHVERLGGGMVSAMGADPTGYWTKAVGIGFDTPVDDALVTEIVRVFRSAGKQSGALAIAPSVLPGDWDDIRARHGLAPGSAWAKLACRIEDVVPATTDLAVRQLVAADVSAWNRIIREAFGMTDPDLTPFLAAALEDPVARVFGAFDGDLLVAAGAVHLLGEVASINTGATLPSHRGRGAQSALLTARAAAAAEAGCRLLSIETGSSSQTNVSFRNVLRAGFTHQYDRVNWIWTA